MTTVGEFDVMIQDMYNAGYVLISLDDLIVKTTNADGSVSISKNTNLYLPEGKKPLIMSEDDLSYYHSYGENGAQGYADRLVIDENGEVKCLFTDTDGQVKIGEGDFTFFVKSGYLIENGRLTAPVKDINVIGNGPQALSDILAVGNDLKIDNGTWTCGKEQSVAVSCGMPTILVKSLTVGGE
jgi:hypothetical protein